MDLEWLTALVRETPVPAQGASVILRPVSEAERGRLDAAFAEEALFGCWEPGHTAFRLARFSEAAQKLPALSTLPPVWEATAAAYRRTGSLAAAVAAAASAHPRFRHAAGECSGGPVEC